MKFWNSCTEFGLIVLFLTSIGTEHSLAALPLQVGVYRSAGNRYIQIAEKENRLCIRNYSYKGVVVASVAADTQRQNFYKINGYGGYDGTFLLQQDTETLLFGSVNHLIKYVADRSSPTSELDDDLQECLSSQKPFLKRKDPSR